jgi:outer membrane protein assembly factor BamB
MLTTYSAYFVATNYGNATWTLADGEVIKNGAFGAIDQQTGVVKWQVAIPNLEISSVSPSVVGDIVITGSQGAEIGFVPGSLIALDKHTGAVLLNNPLDVVFHGGVSFANEYMLVSTGYRAEK